MKKKALYIIHILLVIFLVVLLLPEKYQMPVGTSDSYNHQSFWWHPWTKGPKGRTTPAHIHYGIVTPVPHVWLYGHQYGNGQQPSIFNWMKMFWLNPDEYLRKKQ